MNGKRLLRGYVSVFGQYVKIGAIRDPQFHIESTNFGIFMNRILFITEGAISENPFPPGNGSRGG